MSIFSRFKKKEEPDFDIEKSFDIGKEFDEKPPLADTSGHESGLPPLDTTPGPAPATTPFPQAPTPQFSQPASISEAKPLSFQQQQGYEVRPVQKEEPRFERGKDMELILSRLDTIKAILDSIEVRLRAIEKEATRSEEKRYW